MAIQHHSGPLRRANHVIITRNLPPLWNVDIQGSEFITNNKLFTKVASETMDFVGVDNNLDFIEVFLYRSSTIVRHWRTIYVKFKIKFKASLEERRKLVKALDEKKSLIKKIEVVDGLHQKIVDHQKMVSMKVVENEKLVKAIESLNKNLNCSTLRPQYSQLGQSYNAKEATTNQFNDVL